MDAGDSNPRLCKALIERITDRANILGRELAPTLLPNPGDAQGHNGPE
jgi:hypothetical protein